MEENNYYPFGLKHKGYNNVITGRDHKYGFGGKEYNDELGLDWYDVSARNYDPALGRWMNLDPLAEKMRRYSPYTYSFNSPIAFMDYDGMKADWVPSVNEDGSTTYTAEEGDSAATLASQYGLDQNSAEAITGTEGDTEIAEGTEISGEQVANVTGSEVLALDLNSPEGKSSQRIFDQFLFAADYSKSEGKRTFHSTDFYSNIFGGSSDKLTGNGGISGIANMTIGGESIKIHFDLRLDAGTDRYNSDRGQYIGNTVTRNGQLDTQTFGKTSYRNYFSNLATYDPVRQNGYSTITSSNANGRAVENRFEKK